jgi:sucrose-6-phosphate hydrolase SacC (GH32 family)
VGLDLSIQPGDDWSTKMRMDYGWSGTMSLPRVLSLGADGLLRMNPPEEIERLRYNGQKRTDLTVPADRTVRGRASAATVSN